jgi:AhpD family alkylhydroperoxidase
MTKSIRVFDPPMCCSTGVCGPSVDPALARFASDLQWAASQGATVERFNLAQQPAAFAETPSVRKALQDLGDNCLPLVMVDDAIVHTGSYPSREQLAAWVSGVASTSIFTDAVGELVAIGAAIASNCEPCFKFHYDKARKLGVSREDMLRAVTVAQNVKDSPARAMLELAERHLSREAEPPKPTPCCGGDAPVRLGTRKGGCC